MCHGTLRALYRNENTENCFLIEFSMYINLKKYILCLRTAKLNSPNILNLNHRTYYLLWDEGNAPTPVNINQTDIPQDETVKYLGIRFDRRLTWKDRVLTKRKQLDHKTREIKWLIGRHSPLSLEKITSYIFITSRFSGSWICLSAYIYMSHVLVSVAF
jgi:hypothetical protein